MCHGTSYQKVRKSAPKDGTDLDAPSQPPTAAKHCFLTALALSETRGLTAGAMTCTIACSLTPYNRHYTAGCNVGNSCSLQKEGNATVTAICLT